jgi:hypothetical protein
MPLLQTTLEGKVQRCQFEIAKSTNNSNVRPPRRLTLDNLIDILTETPSAIVNTWQDLRCKLDDAVELSRATASRLHEALEAFHKVGL